MRYTFGHGRPATKVLRRVGLATLALLAGCRSLTPDQTAWQQLPPLNDSAFAWHDVGPAGAIASSQPTRHPAANDIAMRPSAKSSAEKAFDFERDNPSLWRGLARRDAKASASAPIQANDAERPTLMGAVGASDEGQDEAIVLAGFNVAPEKPRRDLTLAQQRREGISDPFDFEPRRRPQTQGPPPPPSVKPGTIAPPPAQRVVEPEPVVMLGSAYGVSADKPGITDNISGRVGGTFSSINEQGNLMGIVGILESSKQLGRRPLFVHSGLALEYLNGQWPVAFSVGGSKLATILGDEVTQPWIFSFTYDGYYDGNFFGTHDWLYLDQVRMLLGRAISPRTDIGVWGALGLRDDVVATTLGPGIVGTIHGRFADRMAGYVSHDFNRKGSQAIISAGWQENPGSFFFEIDTFLRVRENVNLFAGMGYSAGGSFDAVGGLEFFRTGAGQGRVAKSRARWQRYEEDPCACPPVVDCGDCDDVCAPRYRGGWANGVYRGALRAPTPSRMRRWLMEAKDPIIVTPLAATDPVVPPPATNPPVVNPPVVDPPQNPRPPATVDPCPPRLPGHAPVAGRLSQLLEYLDSLPPAGGTGTSTGPIIP